MRLSRLGQPSRTRVGTPRRLLLASTALVAMVSPAVADTTWLPAIGFWETNANWSNNQPDANTDNTILNNGGRAQIASDVVAGSNFGSGTRLTVTNGSIVQLMNNGSLTFGGSADFSNASLWLTGSTAVTSSDPVGSIGLMNSTIESSVDGTLAANIASVSGHNRIIAGAGTTLTLSPGLFFSVTGTSTLHFGSANSGAIVYDGASNTTTNTTAAIAIDGGFLYAGDTGLQTLTAGVGSVTVASGATLAYDDRLNSGNVAIRTLLGDGIVRVGELDPTMVLGVTQGNYGGVIIGVGGLRVHGGASGTLTLTGDNTYTGGTTIDPLHELRLGDFGSTGSILGDVVNNGVLTFRRADVFDFAGNISGTGKVIHDSAGVLQLSGANTYSGGTEIRGILQISSDNNLGAASGGITFNGPGGNLEFLADLTSNRNISIDGGATAGLDTLNNNVTLGGVITGAGGFFKAGTGTLTLTGTNTYTGSTSIDEGMLIVNGSIANSSVTVADGARLGGNGTVGPTTVLNGGAIFPGNSIGTLMVNGPLAFNGGTGVFEVSPTTADRINATGAVTVDPSSGVNVQATGGSYLARRYTLIQGASRTGTFDLLAAIGGFGAFGNLVTNPHLEYDGTSVYFVLDPAQLSALLPNTLSQNQRNVGNAIDRAYAAGGDISSFAPLFGLPGDALGNGLSQLSGEVATGFQQAGLQSTNAFLSLMLDPFAPTRGAGFGPGIGYAAEPRPAAVQNAYAAVTPAQPSFEQRWNVWGAGYGGEARFAGDTLVGSHRTTTRVYGLAGGADFKVSPDTSFGFAMAGGATSWGLAEGLGGGKSDALQAGVYAATRAGGGYLSMAGAYGFHQASTDRTVFGTNRLEASFDAHTYGGRIEGGYRFGSVGFGLTPYAAGQAIAVRTPGFAESATTGSNAFALAYDGRTATHSRSELGAWADATTMLDGGRLVLRGRTAWAHNFNRDRTVNAMFQTLPGAGFTVSGAASAADTALVSAAAELSFTNGWALGARFDGEFGAGTQSFAGTGTVRYAW